MQDANRSWRHSAAGILHIFQLSIQNIFSHKENKFHICSSIPGIWDPSKGSNFLVPTADSSVKHAFSVPHLGYFLGWWKAPLTFRVFHYPGRWPTLKVTWGPQHNLRIKTSFSEIAECSFLSSWEDLCNSLFGKKCEQTILYFILMSFHFVESYLFLSIKSKVHPPLKCCSAYFPCPSFFFLELVISPRMNGCFLCSKFTFTSTIWGCGIALILRLH